MHYKTVIQQENEEPIVYAFDTLKEAKLVASAFIMGTYFFDERYNIEFRDKYSGQVYDMTQGGKLIVSVSIES